MIAGLELRGRNHPELPVELAVVEPVDVRQGGERHIVEPLPRPLVADQLGLVEAVERFGEALSYESPREPTDATTPASARRSE